MSNVTTETTYYGSGYKLNRSKTLTITHPVRGIITNGVGEVKKEFLTFEHLLAEYPECEEAREWFYGDDAWYDAADQYGNRKRRLDD